MSNTLEKVKDYIKIGLDKGLFLLDENKSRIKYSISDKTRNFDHPEEKVQAETFVRLIVDYHYPANRIKMYVPVTMGREVKEADIVVYADDNCTKPYILVECKRQEVSEAEYQQAIEQAYSYAYALPGDVKFVWVTSGIKSDYLRVDKNSTSRERLSDIPQFGVAEVASYKYVYKADEYNRTSGKQKFFDLAVIGRGELTRCFKQAHEALWAGGQLNPSEAFDELDKLIFCKIWDEKKLRKEGEPYDFQVITISKEVEKDDNKRRLLENDDLYKRVKNLYEEGRQQDAEVFRDNIRLTPEKIRTVVSYLQSINLGDTDLDSKGRAFEAFMDSFFRGSFGQYFTPRPVVKFIVDVLPITNTSKVLDTSCGSGGFLLYALDKVRNEASGKIKNYETDPKENNRWYKHWHDFASNNLYGIEISEQISRTAKMNMIIHDDGHTNVITSDGLISDEEIFERTHNAGFKYGTFDFIITNPPFGSSVRQTEKAYLKEYRFGQKDQDWMKLPSGNISYRDSMSTEVLFIEQDYKFLKEGGFLAIILPDGILTSSSMQFVRDQIEEWFRIVAVVSLPQTAFAANGAGVKTSVLFLKKWDRKETDTIVATKQRIKESLLKQMDFFNLSKIMKAANKKKLDDKAKSIKEAQGVTISVARKTDEYKLLAEQVKEEYAEWEGERRDILSSDYANQKADQLIDYPIFMAIAEKIGYDATGKETGVNELVEIGEELKKFMEEENL